MDFDQIVEKKYPGERYQGHLGLLFLAVLENSVLPMGRDSLQETLKVMSVVCKHSLCAVTKTLNEVHTRLIDVHTRLIVNILFQTSIFPIIGKKNNQSSVSDADREIPTIKSTDNAGNSIYRLYPFTLGLGFLGLH